MSARFHFHDDRGEASPKVSSPKVIIRADKPPAAGQFVEGDSRRAREASARMQAER